MKTNGQGIDMALDPEPKEIVFAPSDLSGAIRVACELCVPPASAQVAIAGIIAQMTKLLRAENACVYESRPASSGVMTELYRHEWRDWQTDALSESLTGRRLSAITESCIRMDWNAPGRARQDEPRWHSVASCLPAGQNYYLTLVFARRAQPFSVRESVLLRMLHQSGAFELIAQRLAVPQRAALSPRLREVLSGLLHGRSEKQIASELRRSRHTVHTYVKALYRRYRVNSRGELLSLSIEPAAKNFAAR